MSDSYLTKDTFIVEGIVELDPMSGRYVIRQVEEEFDSQSKMMVGVFDPQAALATLHGQEVRVIVVPLATVQAVEKTLQALESSSKEGS